MENSLKIRLLSTNPRGRNIQFESSMPMAIDCIINFRLKIHQNSCAERKHLSYEI